MNKDDHLIFEALNSISEPELDWYKSKVKEWAGEKPTTESMMAALEKAWTGAAHARFFLKLHEELLKTRGRSNKKRKFMKSGYYPEEDKFDPEFLKSWLQREIMGDFIVNRSGPMPFHTAR